MNKKCSIIVAVIFVCRFSAGADTERELCRNLTGLWHNELGSVIFLSQSQDGTLIGRYSTGVERTNGTSGTSHAAIFGTAPNREPGYVFGFSVMWQDGQSMTSWTGQCLVCGNEEVLKTSWLLRSRVDGCVDKWKSSLIGQNTFTRTPHGITIQNTRGRRSRSTPDRVSYAKRSTVVESHVNVKQACSLDGHWYNELGSEMILTTNPNNTVTGQYRTAVERCKGSAGTSPSHVHGMTSVGQNGNTTVALFVVWNNGKSVTGWVGQCHVCGVNGSEVLPMTWLLRSHIQFCDDDWKATQFGETVFTRHEQTSGPRKRLGTHSPGQAGERNANTQTCSADVNVATTSVLLFSVFLFIFV
jgi:hypothetical protein